jgi:hypothetical protein
MQSTLTALLKPLIIVTLLASALSACGAGTGDDAVPAAAGGGYDAIASYCGADKPNAAQPVRDGWGSSWPYLNDNLNNAATIVSPDGSSTAWDEPIVMKVEFNDYRGVSGPMIAKGSVERWSMGASIPTLLPKRAVACTTQLSKKVRNTQPVIEPGGVIGSVTTYTLAWKSYWDRALPLDRLNGYAVDGFEFVANFTPGSGQAFFVMDKTRFAGTAGLSVCYLAPGSVNWDCAVPASTDLGYGWQLTRPGMKPGAWMLVSASPRA